MKAAKKQTDMPKNLMRRPYRNSAPAQLLITAINIIVSSTKAVSLFPAQTDIISDSVLAGFGPGGVFEASLVLTESA